MLLQYSENIQHSLAVTVSGQLGLDAQRAVLAIFKDARMEGIDTEIYDSPQSVYIEIIMQGDAVKLGAIARHLTFVTCSTAPTLHHLLGAGFLKEKNMIVLLTLLIDQVSRFFEKPTTKSAEELAWIMLDDYKRMSIEDFIKFFDLCKRKYFSNEYQHISSRGVNADYLLDWLEKYEDERKESIRSAHEDFRKRFSDLPRALDEIGRVKIGEIIKADAKKVLQKEKIAKLRERHESHLKEQSAKERLVHFIADQEIYFLGDYCLRTVKERIEQAELTANRLIEEWKKEFHVHLRETPSEQINEFGNKEVTADSFQTKINNEGEKCIVRVTALTVEKYIESQIRKYLKEHGKKIKCLLPINIFRNGLRKYTLFHNIENGKQLYQLVEPEFPVNTFCEPTRAINKMASKLRSRLSNAYNRYVNEKLDKGELPRDREDYMRKRAHQWVVQNCCIKNQKPKN